MQEMARGRLGTGQTQKEKHEMAAPVPCHFVIFIFIFFLFFFFIFGWLLLSIPGMELMNLACRDAATLLQLVCSQITIADNSTASVDGWPDCGLSVRPDNGDRRPGSLVVASPTVQCRLSCALFTQVPQLHCPGGTGQDKASAAQGCLSERSPWEVHCQLYWYMSKVPVPGRGSSSSRRKGSALAGVQQDAQTLLVPSPGPQYWYSHQLLAPLQQDGCSPIIYTTKLPQLVFLRQANESEKWKLFWPVFSCPKEEKERKEIEETQGKKRSDIYRYTAILSPIAGLGLPAASLLTEHAVLDCAVRSIAPSARLGLGLNFVHTLRQHRHYRRITVDYYYRPFRACYRFLFSNLVSVRTW